MKSKKNLMRFLDDWPVKVLCVAAALCIFFFFNLTRLEQRYLSVPLVVSLNDDYVPSNIVARSVRVSLRGERDTLYTLREDDIGAAVDLSAFHTEGSYRVPVRLLRRGDAIGVDPLELSADPAEILVNLEKKATKKIPVTPAFKGFLESGFELVSFDLEPAQLTLAGPESAIAKTNDISTETITLTGRKADFTVDAQVLRKDMLLHSVGTDTVRVRVRVRKALDARTLENLTIEIHGMARGLVLSEPLPKAAVRVHIAEGSAPLAATGALLSVDFSPCTKPGIYTLPVVFTPPAGAIPETYEPQTVTVKLVAASESP